MLSCKQDCAHRDATASLEASTMTDGLEYASASSGDDNSLDNSCLPPPPYSMAPGQMDEERQEGPSSVIYEHECGHCYFDGSCKLRARHWLLLVLAAIVTAVYLISRRPISLWSMYLARYPFNTPWSTGFATNMKFLLRPVCSSGPRCSPLIAACPTRNIKVKVCTPDTLYPFPVGNTANP
jgi:hypothetical protein